MSLRSLKLATQFLTRLPVPRVHDFSPADLSRSAMWFPFVGAMLGVMVAAVVLLCTHRGVLLASALGVLAWVWLTGALHLDGLADLVDALAASHRDPRRFQEVLADPHLGAFGVIALVLALLLKFALLSALSGRALLELPLVLAWARLGPLAWSRWLEPLKSGHAERFAWQLHTGWIIAWVVSLLLLSALYAPTLMVAPLVIFAWGLWLKARVGGVSGDCLGAGVEVTEIALLLVVVFTSGVVPGLL